MLKLIHIGIIILFALSSYGQTCCSGGVPVSSNIGFRNENANHLQLALVHEYNVLKTLKTGKETLKDRKRSRITNSLILRAAYAWTEKISTEVFIPWVNQSRTINSISGVDQESTAGLGDPILLTNFKVLETKIFWSAGVGIQFPIGSTSERNSRGLLLIEDLQPGSGALDVLFMSLLEYPLPFRPQATAFASFIQTINGTNNSSRGGLASYSFGNESQFSLGYSDQLLIANSILPWGLAFRYRKARTDKLNQNNLPGTGGDFGFVRTNLGYTFNKNLSQLNILFELPFFRYVQDTQLTPTYTINVSWSMRLALKKKNPKTIITI